MVTTYEQGRRWLEWPEIGRLGFEHACERAMSKDDKRVRASYFY